MKKPVCPPLIIFAKSYTINVYYFLNTPLYYLYSTKAYPEPCQISNLVGLWISNHSLTACRGDQEWFVGIFLKVSMHPVLLNEGPFLESMDASSKRLRKGRHQYSTCAKISLKTNISWPLIRRNTCAYQGVRNVSFSEKFVYILNGWSQVESD